MDLWNHIKWRQLRGTVTRERPGNCQVPSFPWKGWKGYCWWMQSSSWYIKLIWYDIPCCYWVSTWIEENIPSGKAVLTIYFEHHNQGGVSWILEHGVILRPWVFMCEERFLEVWRGLDSNQGWKHFSVTPSWCWQSTLSDDETHQYDVL